MKRHLIILAVVLAALVGGYARPVHAGILPDCDKTVYYVVDKTKSGGCTAEDTSGCFDGKAITPERYEEIATASGDAETWKEEHPPTVSINTKCGFNDFVQLFINLAAYGLAVLAVLGVAVIVWGGFGFLLAMGSQEKIKTAKQTLWGGILGTFIVLIAFVMVNFIVSMLTGNGPVLFAGTENATYFYGDKCPTYKACSTNNLYYDADKGGCKDSTKNNGAVTKAQTLLAELGCYTGSIDGCYGPKTEEAMANFQSSNSTFFKPEKSGAISSADEWQILEDAAAGNGGYLTCSGAPMTTNLTVSINSSNADISKSDSTIQQHGTVTWTNTSAQYSPITITFDPEETQTTLVKSTVTIDPSESASFTFYGAGKFGYTVSGWYQTTQFQTTGTINVIL